MALGLYETDYGGGVILYVPQRAFFQKGEAMIVNLVKVKSSILFLILMKMSNLEIELQKSHG